MVLMGLSSVSFCKILYYLFLHAIAEISNISSFSFMLLLFTENGREYIEVLYMSATKSGGNFIVWYVVKAGCLIRLELTLFYQYLSYSNVH